MDGGIREKICPDVPNLIRFLEDYRSNNLASPRQPQWDYVSLDPSIPLLSKYKTAPGFTFTFGPRSFSCSAVVA